LPLFVVYNVAFLGSISGGWLPARFLALGWSLNRARKITLLICALLVAPVMFATQVHSLWATVVLISMAAAGHQGWSANVWTLTSDVFPRKAIGSIAGIAGFSSAMASVLFQKSTGYILQYTGSYSSIFIIGGLAYLTALAIVQTLMPRLEPVKLE
jgi:ACS family hexuronate transporter-like MFS transporter